MLRLTFRAPVFTWRGPSPYHFVEVPPKHCRDLDAVSAEVTYGWGMIPVTATLRGTEWKTSLFPRNGRYLVPIKDVVRTAGKVRVGERVTLRLEIATRW